MRNFYYRIAKNLISIYIVALLVLTYRLVYNEFYFQLQEDISVSIEEEKYVYPCGNIVGIYTNCDGIFVIDTCEIENENGESINIANNSVKTGDYIIAINGMDVSRKEELVETVKKSEGTPISLKVKRGSTIFTTEIIPLKANNGEYMLGIWVKDDLAGIGTITYFTDEGKFAALGHGMGDGETQNLLKISGGDVYVSNIVGIEKGKKGDPGEIKGVIYYGANNHIGELFDNNGMGVYGVLDKEEQLSYISQYHRYVVANEQEIKQGNAKILSAVSGELDMYDIEITYVDYLAKDSNKGLHIKVTDSELIELTGGIVQGMSGSPIIQNGKLIGAITHVLINDPAQGYGIFIDKMIE